jgi:hypothetical protein
MISLKLIRISGGLLYSEEYVYMDRSTDVVIDGLMSRRGPPELVCAV